MVSTSLIIIGIAIGALVLSGVAQNALAEVRRTKTQIKKKTRKIAESGAVS